MKKTQRMKRTVCLILIAAMVFSVFLISGCGEKAKDSEQGINETKNDSPDSEADKKGDDSTEEIRIDPDLPDIDLEGYTFNFLTHLYDGDDWVGTVPMEIIAEEQNGEPINDAVYTRNLKIEEKYNINIKMEPIADETKAMKKTVAAGDSTYDAVIMFNNNVPGIVTADLLTNIADLTHIDLGKPWWDPAVNAMSIDNKNYLLAGDLLILDNEATNVILFNKELMNTLGFDLPYNIAKDGKWTMDKLNEYIKGSAFDINGDGSMKPLDDRWGFVTFNDTMHALFVGGGGALAVKDANDIPYMDFTSPSNLNIIEKAMDIMYNKEEVLNVQADVANQTEWTQAFYTPFEQNRTLFMWARMRVVEKYRGMEAEFGILPIPKFDENQENYRSVVNPYTGVLLGVPKSADNLERVSIILEALSAESRYTLQPAYYNVVLQRKYVRDDESSEMLDIIFNTRVYDIGSVYSFGNVFIDFISLCYKTDRNVVSFYDKKSGSMEKAINKVVETFQSMD